MFPHISHRGWTRSHNADLGGGLEGVLVLGQDHVGLLLTSGSNHSVYFAHLDVVEVLDALADHGLGRTAVNNKDQGVVILGDLHCALGGLGVFDNCVLVPGSLASEGVADDLLLAGKRESLGETESDLGPSLVLCTNMFSILHYFDNFSSLIPPV